MLPNVDLTPTFILTIAGALLSLVASYVPGFREWYAALGTEKKRQVMLLAILVVSLALIVLSITNVWVTITMTKEGWIVFALSVILSITSNQGVYKLSPQVEAVVEIKDRVKLAEKVGSSLPVVEDK